MTSSFSPTPASAGSADIKSANALTFESLPYKKCVLVTDLRADFTQDIVKSCFEVVGAVENVFIVATERNGKNQFVVVFSTDELARRALLLDRTELLGSVIRVEPSIKMDEKLKDKLVVLWHTQKPETTDKQDVSGFPLNLSDRTESGKEAERLKSEARNHLPVEREHFKDITQEAKDAMAMPAPNRYLDVVTLPSRTTARLQEGGKTQDEKKQQKTDSSLTTTASATMGNTMGQAKEKLHSAVEQVTQAAGVASIVASVQYENAKDLAKDKVAEAKEAAAAGIDYAKETLTHVYDSAAEMVTHRTDTSTPPVASPANPTAAPSETLLGKVGHTASDTLHYLGEKAQAAGQVIASSATHLAERVGLVDADESIGDRLTEVAGGIVGTAEMARDVVLDSVHDVQAKLEHAAHALKCKFAVILNRGETEEETHAYEEEVASTPSTKSCLTERVGAELNSSALKKKWEDVDVEGLYDKAANGIWRKLSWSHLPHWGPQAANRDTKQPLPADLLRDIQNTGGYPMWRNASKANFNKTQTRRPHYARNFEIQIPPAPQFGLPKQLLAEIESVGGFDGWRRGGGRMSNKSSSMVQQTQSTQGDMAAGVKEGCSFQEQHNVLGKQRDYHQSEVTQDLSRLASPSTSSTLGQRHYQYDTTSDSIGGSTKDIQEGCVFQETSKLSSHAPDYHQPEVTQDLTQLTRRSQGLQTALYTPLTQSRSQIDPSSSQIPVHSETNDRDRLNIESSSPSAHSYFGESHHIFPEQPRPRAVGPILSEQQPLDPLSAGTKGIRLHPVKDSAHIIDADLGLRSGTNVGIRPQEPTKILREEADANEQVRDLLG
eukprot:GILJ01015347.1.p1 GENE.GILJ01015347.1~~GILJ01015347.1.p1  ORF type:complete len:834 (-),score=134.14 GILJ01015347.1:181-2682(-)